MRKTSLLVGVGLVLIGLIWAFQGYGTLKGSFMTGSPTWMWVGLVCVVAGIALVVVSRRRRPRRRASGTRSYR